LKDLIIHNTPKTPEINFNHKSGVFEISGITVPEDSIGFYKKIIDWVKNYVKNPAPNTKVIFKLTYINTSSLQALYDFFLLLNQIHNKTSSVKIEWHHLSEDDDMKEIGEDFKEALTVDFSFVAVQVV